jgi:hypothetical protein
MTARPLSPGSPASPGAGDNGHPRVVALARELERTTRRVSELDQLVRDLADQLASFATPDNEPSPKPGDEEVAPPAVRAWLQTADPNAGLADLTELIDWLDQVYLAYPDAVVPACWLWHPAVVEELWWLRCAHVEAYHPKVGTWLRVGDWHDRQRPNVAARIRKAVHGCELALHTPGGRRDHQTRAPLGSAAEQIAAWTADGCTATPPAPSPGQLAEAEAYDNAQHRSLR